MDVTKFAKYSCRVAITNEAQQATRAMLRRANNNHEPEEYEEGSDDPGQGRVFRERR